MSGAIYNLNLILDGSTTFSKMSWQLFLICSPLLFLCLFSRSFIILCIIYITPNFIINVGGAEKTGFVTHYHSFYIPILIIGSIVGYSNIKNIISKKYLSILLLIIILSVNIYFSQSRIYVVSPTLTHSLFRDSELVIKKTDLSKYSIDRRNALKYLLKDVDKNSSISATEFLMPVLVWQNFKSIDYFPIGAGNSTYLLTESNLTGLEFLLTIVANKEDKEKIEKCIHSIVDNQYENLNHIDINGIRYILWKKNQ
jgi:hypothetical protein